MRNVWEQEPIWQDTRLVVAHGNERLDQQATVQQQQPSHEGQWGNAAPTLEEPPHLQQLRPRYLSGSRQTRMHVHATRCTPPPPIAAPNLVVAGVLLLLGQHHRLLSGLLPVAQRHFQRQRQRRVPPGPLGPLAGQVLLQGPHQRRVPAPPHQRDGAPQGPGPCFEVELQRLGGVARMLVVNARRFVVAPVGEMRGDAEVLGHAACAACMGRRVCGLDLPGIVLGVPSCCA